MVLSIVPRGTFMNIRVFCLFILILISLGCRREDPNPELSDPIYLDLLKDLRSLESEKESAEKKIEKATKELAKSAPRTLDKKNAENDLLKAQKTLEKIIQLIEFYKIHSEHRRVEGRAAYKAAFNKGEKWPDPKEGESYFTNKRLRTAPRSWSERVPKSKFSTQNPDGSHISLEKSGGKESEKGGPAEGGSGGGH